MPLSPEHLEYPDRRYGMDHDRYGWSDLFERAPVAWPGGTKVALWVTPILQWFPLNAGAKPFRAPSGLTMPYPDLRHYTGRDYGNRVGIFRILDLLDELRCPASVAMNAAVAERYPTLVGDVVGRGHELLAHGQDMGTLHHSGLSAQEEGAIVSRALGTLRQVSGQTVTGWLSPGRAQSFATPDILAANGVRYACDWANDDMPFAMRTATGSLWAMPLAQETEDRTVLLDLHHTEDDWLVQLKDRFDTLYREADRFGGRIVSVPLHAWVAGVPYRIGIVREALSYMLSHDAVWAATGSDILAAFQAASGDPHG